MTNEKLDDYYKRQPITRWSESLGRFYEDWKMPIDAEAEDALIEILRSLNPQGDYRKFNDPFSPLDFGIFRDGELVAVAELKRRNTVRRAYYTVPLNFRKIRGFARYSAKGIKGYYFIMWADEIGYINVLRAEEARVGRIGTKRIVKSQSDINDKAYMIPQEWFTHLCQSPHLPQS